MWFKNLRLYRFTEKLAPASQGESTLNETLSKHPFTPLTGLQETTFGWVHPFQDSALLCEQLGGRLFITAQIQQKILPPAVLNEALADQVNALEEAEGRRPGRKERDALKEQIRAEMLPKAFHKTRRISAWIDLDRGWLAINAAAEKDADDFTAHLREALGSLPVVPLGKSHAGSATLTDWYQDPAERPEGTELTEDLQLTMNGDPSVKARYKNLDMEAPEIRHSLDSGMGIRQLGLSINNQCTCVIDDNFTLKRLKFSEALIEQTADSDDPRTDALLMSDTLTQWLGGLLEQLEGESHD